MEARKQAIITALERWINQRPGLEYGNYGNATSYRSELRSITKDLHHARILLRAVSWRDSITADDLINAAKHSYSGRLEVKQEPHQYDAVICPGRPCGSECDHTGEPYSTRIEYCTGQYWPTEYRRAVCAVLASVLWYHTREHAMPSAIVKDGEQVYPHCSGARNTQSAGDWLRGHFRREFGRGMQQRWFD